MAIYDFIRESNSCESMDDLIECYLKFLGFFDIHHFLMFDFLYKFSPVARKTFKAMISYPRSLPNFYYANYDINFDPASLRTEKNRNYFIWEEREIKEKFKKELIVADKTTAGNCDHGIGFPIHRPLGKTIYMCLGSFGNNFSFDKETSNILHLGILHFFMTYSEMLNTGDMESHDIKLTDREREVLHWIACGKTKSEVAEILSVSESCIKRHCENMFVKLKVKNLPSAIAKALSLRLISLYSAVYICFSFNYGILNHLIEIVL